MPSWAWKAALAQPQVAHRETIQHGALPTRIGDIKLFNLTAQFEKTPGAIETPPPRLSGHTDEILGSLGYSKDDILRLRERGVV